MGFGQAILDMVIDSAGPLVIAGLIIAAVYMVYKRKLTELIGVVFLGMIALGVIYNPTGVKDVMVRIFNAIIGSGS